MTVEDSDRAAGGSGLRPPESAPAGSIAPGGPAPVAGPALDRGQRPPTGPTPATGTGESGAVTELLHAEQSLDLALDHALDAIDRHADDLGELTDAEKAENAAAVAGDPDAIRAVTERRRPAGLRTVLATMSSRVTAERNARAAEAALAAAQATQQAATAMDAADRPTARPSLHPFRVGFLGGLGLMLAYITYLSLDTVRSTLIVIAVAALLAIGLDPVVSWMVRRGLKRRAGGDGRVPGHADRAGRCAATRSCRPS